MKILCIVPARYASTRFPAKPLVDIAGKSMIRRVYEQVLKSDLISRVVVATDHSEIFAHVQGFGGNVCLTDENHASGTDRCYEALQHEASQYDYVINVQGDEPFIQPEQINLLAGLLDGKTEIATLVKTLDSEEFLFNPNIVKAVLNNKGEAMYFSRSPIPHFRNAQQNEWIHKHQFHKHIGMYAYRADILASITSLSVSSLERAESLEQLRWLENGFRIQCAVTEIETLGIDTPDDLTRALRQIQ